MSYAVLNNILRVYEHNEKKSTSYNCVCSVIHEQVSC
jgi:hypothetical protein